MRMTLHVAAADDFPAYAQLVQRGTACARCANAHPELDEQRVARRS